MKLFDFMKRTPAEVPIDLLKMAAAPPKATEVEGHEPEDILDRPWGFKPIAGMPSTYTHADIMAMAAVASARAMMSIADDVEAMRKHMTRLQLVQPREESQSVAAVDPVEGIDTGGSTRVSASSESTCSQATDRAVDGR